MGKQKTTETQDKYFNQEMFYVGNLIKELCPAWEKINDEKKALIYGDILMWLVDKDINIYKSIKIDDNQINELKEKVDKVRKSNKFIVKNKSKISHLKDGTRIPKEKHSGKVGASGRSEISDNHDHESAEHEQYEDEQAICRHEDDVQEGNYPHDEIRMLSMLYDPENNDEYIDNNYDENGKRIIQRRILIRNIWLRLNADTAG